MKMEVLSEKENPLMKRKEYWLLADHSGKETPSRHELISEVAKKLGSKEDVTVLCKVFSERGIAKSRIKVFVYNDRKDVPKEQLARQEAKVRKLLEKKAAAVAAPEEKPAEEAPSSEEKPVEDAPEEEKKEEAPFEEAPEEDNAAEKPEEKAHEKEKKEETSEEKKDE